MKKIFGTVLALVFGLLLTACGGGSNSDGGVPPVSCCANPSGADQGIWSNLDSNKVGITDSNNSLIMSSGMQVVILDDGSFWALMGSINVPFPFSPEEGLHGTVSLNGNNVTGSFPSTTGGSSFSGTLIPQTSLDLNFTPPLSDGTPSTQLSYDSIYSKSTSLASLAGTYTDASEFLINGPVNGMGSVIFLSTLKISGSNLTFLDNNGNVVMTGVITPHGTNTSVFDVALTVTTSETIFGFFYNITQGTKANGILFKSSTGILQNNIELIFAAGDTTFFFIGK